MLQFVFCCWLQIKFNFLRIFFCSNHSNLLLVIYSTRVKKEQKRGNRLTLEFNPVFVPIAQNLGRTVKECLASDFTLVLLTHSEYHRPLSVYFFPPCLLPLLIEHIKRSKSEIVIEDWALPRQHFCIFAFLTFLLSCISALFFSCPSFYIFMFLHSHFSS